MSELVAVLLVGLGTYASRSVFILTLANRPLPMAALRALQYVAPSVLSALVVALLIDSEGAVTAGLPEAAAFVAGGFVAYKTRSHVFTLIVGMAVFWLVRELAG